MLCDVCRNIGLSEDGRAELISEKQIHPHHQSYMSLVESVNLGCLICIRLWKALEPDEERFIIDSLTSNLPSDLIEQSTSTMIDSGVVTKARLGLPGSHVPLWSPDDYLLQIAFELVAGFPANTERYWRVILFLTDSHESVEISKVPSWDTKSDESMCLSNIWLKSCTTNHLYCSAPTSTQGWHPTRLLDCGPLEWSEPKCQVVETIDMNFDQPYTTLSHCWGHAECLKLTTRNYSQMTDVIPFQTLPQLYQDAVYVSRKLGIRYLWIDSLCIVQEGDELQDWSREVKVMDKVYSNSFCNIAASEAQSGHDTMFYTRNPASLDPFVAHFNVEGRAGSYIISNAWFWDEEVEDALINTRGWVLQERLLSPRVLYLGKRQIFWECREKSWCELYPNGMPGPNPSAIAQIKLYIATNGFMESQRRSRRSLFRMWSDVVSAYSRTRLTFASDKLVAFSAIAKSMKVVFNDDYIVGMWRRRLEFELLWSMTPVYAKGATRPDIYRAPSWSWMSIEGTVGYGRRKAIAASRRLFQILDVALDHTTDDDTGPVKGGWLQLRGALKQLTLVCAKYDRSDDSRVWGMLVNGTHISVPAELWGLQPHVELDPPFTDSRWQDVPGSLYCMPARQCVQGEEDIFILIFEVVDHEKGIYRRMGFAHGWGGDMQEKLGCRSEEEHAFPCEEFSDGLHTIRVI